MFRKKILVVIPVRGNSKGIPGKNKRFINGKPLMAYAIEHALTLSTEYEADVVVDTEDVELAEIAEIYGAKVVQRPNELSGDEITLDPVIYHALNSMELELKCRYDIVITMQATSPTLKPETLKKALFDFEENGYDTIISVVDDRHLGWTEKKEKIVPAYSERKNRQYLPLEYRETGAFVITKRECVTVDTRIGDNVSIYEISSKEAVDIDTAEDFILCEKIMQSKKILFYANGEEKLGMGHVYRCLSIAYQLTGNEVLFVSDAKCELGIKKIEESFFPIRKINSQQDLLDVIREYRPDVLVNDILNTTQEYMSLVRNMVPRIVNFEDEGKGALKADAVINALYFGKPRCNEYKGFEYFFIRDEFFLTGVSDFHSEVKNVVVLFGGTDPSDLTRKILPVLEKVADQYLNIKFNIVTGFGYSHKYEIQNDERHRIYIQNDVKRVSTFMKDADLAITSQGRTIYELAYMGVPSIVLAQNRREMSHEFAEFQNGYINLGLGEQIDTETIFSTIDWLIRTPNVRKQMHDLMLTKDFKSGKERVLNLILGK